MEYLDVYAFLGVVVGTVLAIIGGKGKNEFTFWKGFYIRSNRIHCEYTFIILWIVVPDCIF